MARLTGFKWVPAPVAGLPYRDDDFAWKVLWHSTETPPSPGAAERLSRVHRNPPQLWVDVFNRERVQGIDTSLAGRALKASPAVETNRDRVIQIELIGYARDMHRLTDDHFFNDLFLCGGRVGGRRPLLLRRRNGCEQGQ